MRFLLLFCFSILMINSYGQVERYKFSSAELKGYSEMIVTMVMHAGNESSALQITYHINKLGQIEKEQTRNEVVTPKKEVLFILEEEKFLKYNADGLLVEETLEMPTIETDPVTGKDNVVLQKNVSKYFYSGKKCIKKVDFEDTANKTVCTLVTSFIYDDKARVIKELQFEGPSDGGLKDIRNDERTATSKIIYQYKEDSVTTTEYKKDKVVRYKHSKLDRFGNSTYDVIRDGLRNKIAMVSSSYNDRGKFVRSTPIFKSSKAEGIECVDLYEISYNGNGLPKKTLLKNVGLVVEETIVYNAR